MVKQIKFTTKLWVEINDAKINFSKKMLRLSLCDYRDVYILVKGNITITRETADEATRLADKIQKEVIFKHHFIIA